MSIELMTQVWKYSKHKESKLLLLLAIADYADENGYAWPSARQLSERIRIGERQTRYLLRELERAGELVTALQVGPDRRNGYQVTITEPCVEGAAQRQAVRDPAGGSPAAQEGAVSPQKRGQSDSPIKQPLDEPLKEPPVAARAHEKLKPVFEDPVLTVSAQADARLADAFPWVEDRQLQYKQAAIWLEAHEKRARRPLAFLLNWFKREPAPPTAPLVRERAPEVARAQRAISRFLPEDRDPLDQACWARVLGSLEEQLDPGNFDTWIRPLRLLGVKDAISDGRMDRIALLGGPSEIFVEWFQENVDGAAACKAAAAGITKLEIIEAVTEGAL